MPLDSILAVFQKLEHIDILMGADQVCRSWRRAARDEPVLWRRIVMRGNAELAFRLNRQGMACAAVQRSQGQCEAFCGEYAGDDGFPLLKSLRLISCAISLDGLEEQLTRFHLLEELELSQCPELIRTTVHEILQRACPQLKHFRTNKHYFHERRWIIPKDLDAEGIATMHELRSLQLIANDLTNKGLAAILENCPHLESLDLRHCFNIDMDSVDDDEGTLLREKCARIKTVRLPRDSMDDCDFKVGSPRFACKEIDYDSPYDTYLWESLSENSDDDYSGPSRYEADLDKYEKVLPRSMRTFL
ncbi:putative F-box/LRR-repeat protein 23 [Lolium rigidum]|uniref:putative F-box/LRR-repeat protein 23 n=1 Tax=Lolium rigidum TaxID=89674 RepID=UPI001F5C6C71|nr:putative F-box/LRR-repeat protein 23 [Lolium rigidum]